MAHDEELRMSFTEHLGELRDRLIYSAIAVVVSFVICYGCSNIIFKAVSRPLDPLAQSPLVEWITGTGAPATDKPPATAPDGTPLPNPAKPTAQWTTLNPIEGMVVQLKLGIYFGLMLSLPFILYQICAFIFPGLKPSERRMVQLMIAGCSVLGTVGVLIAYFAVFPIMLPYLLQWTPPGVVVQLRMSETINIILIGLVGFAIAFQFPMVVLVLVYMNILTPATLRKQRRLAIVGLAFVSAVFTPPDPVSMVIMLVPLVILYELSIIVGSVVARRHATTDIVPVQE